jgi:uncharacterized membrane protein
MKKPRIAFKPIWRAAWQKTKQHFWKLLLAFIILMLIGIVFDVLNPIVAGVIGRTTGAFIAAIVIMEIISGLIQVYFTITFTRMFLDIARDRTVTVRNLFSKVSGFTFWLFVVTTILASLAITIGFIALIIPGIIIALALWMVGYLAIDTPQPEGKKKIFKHAIGTLKASWSMTSGYRWRLLVFVIAIVGWNILGLLALGIGVLVAIPFTSLAAVLMYEHLRTVSAGSSM